MEDFDYSFSFDLFSRPSFLEGMARVIDMGGGLNIYNTSGSGAEADSRAIASDWKAIGDDIKKVLGRE
ncbi:MAG: hypothetical protein LBU79_00240 [Planctomycetota bacterium]|jgi:hypothetical protein|nr:hypothetical protein [Planctomycetota bacterium]